MTLRHNCLLACVSLSALLSGGAAIAADATPVADKSSGPIAEVVVTAQKREQSLQKVPVSVTALTASTLTQAGVVDMQGVSNMVPAMTAQESNGPQAQSYHIRGIGSSPDIPTFEPDVALFIDGVYLPRSGLSVDDLADLARVEVLEGPQSTLYGKNATAGVINIVTTGPSRRFEARVEGTVSNLEGGRNASAYRLLGTISGPISDRLRARLSVVTYDQDPTFKNLVAGAPDANNMHRYSVRGEVEADLWADTTLRVDASRSEIYHTRAGDSDVMYYAYPGQPGAGPLGNSLLTLDTLLGPGFHTSPCANNDINDRKICTSSPYQTSGYSNVLSGALNSKLGRNSFTSITALTDYKSHVYNPDIAQLIIPVFAYNDLMKGGTFSQEFRLTSPTGDKLEWLAGLYYQHTNFGRGDDGKTPMFIVEPASAFIPLPGAPNPPFPNPPVFVLGQPGDLGYVNSKSRSNYSAAFGQATYHFNEAFALSLGARIQHEEKHASVLNSSSISPTTPAIPLGPCGAFPLNLLTASLTPSALPGCPLVPVNANFSHGTDLFTWNATGEYHLDNVTMLYLTVSRGAKAFGYNIGFGNALPSQRPFKDEYVYNYEAGVKTSLFDGRARLAASVFRANYHNFQNASFVGLQFLVNNAKQVSVTGAEASGTFALGHGFTANAAATYVDASYDTYTDGACYWWAAGAPFAPPSVNPSGTCNLSGKTLPQAPHWRTSLGLQYQRNLSLGDFYSRADWSWQSSQYTSGNLDPRSLEAAYSVVNLRAGLKLDNGLDVSVFGNNVFNQTYATISGVTNLFGPSDPAWQKFLGAPREYGVTLRKSF